MSVRCIRGQEKIGRKELVLVSSCTSPGETSKVGNRVPNWNQRVEGETHRGEGIWGGVYTLTLRAPASLHEFPVMML